MCTVTILNHNQELIITMNRDDSKTRPEDGVKIFEDGQSTYMSPIDQVSGGTWTAVNQQGIAMC